MFPLLASPNTSIKTRYDIVVVGSGYGGAIAASRCARAGQSVCVLERGKEWRPGDFSEDFKEFIAESQVTVGGLQKQIGRKGFFSNDSLCKIAKMFSCSRIAHVYLNKTETEKLSTTFVFLKIYTKGTEKDRWCHTHERDNLSVISQHFL